MSVRQASAGMLLVGGLLVGCGSPQPPGTAGQLGSLSATCVPGYTDMFAPDGIQYGSDNGGSQPDGSFYRGTPASGDSLEPAPAIEVTVRKQRHVLPDRNCPRRGDVRGQQRGRLGNAEHHAQPDHCRRAEPVVRGCGCLL